MPNDPPDDFLRNLAKMVEDIIRMIPDHERGQVIGYTIIAGRQGEAPRIVHFGNEQQEETEYEVIEDDSYIFVTATIPAGSRYAAYADISPDAVTIVIGDIRTTIPLKSRIDVIHSFYQVRNRVIDIVLKKKKGK